MSNEAFYGYASAGPYVMIDKSMYDRISNNDFRKLEDSDSYELVMEMLAEEERKKQEGK